jgi:peptidoglycan hydrolase-like protein with peptidoglycan-binding domain
MAEPVLKKGSSDPVVRDLQQALKALGHDPGPIDGVFGAQTESAVGAFQQAREIAADGVVGRVTWINIDEADQGHPVLKTGATGLPVRRLQSRMSAVGFDTGGVDGRFGARTETAVRQLQRQASLTVDRGRRPQNLGRRRRAGERGRRKLTEFRRNTSQAPPTMSPKTGRFARRSSVNDGIRDPGSRPPASRQRIRPDRLSSVAPAAPAGAIHVRSSMIPLTGSAELV